VSYIFILLLKGNLGMLKFMGVAEEVMEVQEEAAICLMINQLAYKFIRFYFWLILPTLDC